MFGQELQRGIGEDEVRLILGRPIRNVLLDELSLRRAHARMREHGVGGVEADDLCVREAIEQQFRAVAGTTTQIIDETRRTERNPRQEIARRAHALGLELRVECRVPVGHQHESSQRLEMALLIAQIEG